MGGSVTAPLSTMDIGFSLNDSSFWIALAVLVVVFIAAAVLSFLLIRTVATLRARPPATAAAGAGDQPPESEEPPEARDPFAPVDKRAVLEPELYDPLGAISPFEEELPLEESLDAPPGYDPAFDTSVPVEESLDPPLGHDPALDPSFPIEEPLNPSPGYDPAFDTSSPWEVARPDLFDLPPDLPTAETPLPSPDARHFGFDDEPLIPVAPIEPNPASADPASADLASPDLASPDLASPDLAGPDLASPDLASPDLASADLASADLASPDLAGPDLAGPDLASPDLASPDLASPDPASPDLASPDPASPDLASPDLASPDLASAHGGWPPLRPEPVFEPKPEPQQEPELGRFEPLQLVPDAEPQALSFETAMEELSAEPIALRDELLPDAPASEPVDFDSDPQLPLAAGANPAVPSDFARRNPVSPPPRAPGEPLPRGWLSSRKEDAPAARTVASDEPTSDPFSLSTSPAAAPSSSDTSDPFASAGGAGGFSIGKSARVGPTQPAATPSLPDGPSTPSEDNPFVAPQEPEPRSVDAPPESTPLAVEVPDGPFALQPQAVSLDDPLAVEPIVFSPTPGEPATTAPPQPSLPAPEPPSSNQAPATTQASPEAPVEGLRFPTDILGREPIRAAHAAAQGDSPSPMPFEPQTIGASAPPSATLEAPLEAPLEAFTATLVPPPAPAAPPLPAAEPDEPATLEEPPPLGATGDPRSAFVAAGVRLHYLEWGPADQPTIILLHGLTGNAHNYDALAQQVSAWYRLIAVDLRGHGDSAWHLDQDYRLSSYVRDLDKLIASLKLPSLALVGTALGADVALAYAGARPAVVGRLVLNDSGPDINRAGADRIRRYIEDAPQGFKDMDAAIQWWRENYPILRNYDDNVLQTFVEYSVRRQDDGSFTWKFDPAFRRLAGDFQLRDVDLWASAGLVRTPTLIVRGADSDILSVGVAQRLREAIEDAQVVEVPGVGHAPSLVEPEFLPVLRRFLQ